MEVRLAPAERGLAVAWPLTGRPGLSKSFQKVKTSLFFWRLGAILGDFMRSRGIFQNGIPLTRGQVNPGRPCLAPPGVSKSENSLVFIGRERFWRSGWRPVAVDWPLTGR